MSHQAQIEHFFSVVSQAQQEALGAKPSHTRLILYALFDALSHAADPTNRANRNRFVGFIDAYARWSLASAYSIRQLSMLLAEPSAPSLSPHFTQLQAEVATRMSRFSPYASPV